MKKSIGRSICVLLCLFTLASALSGCGGGGGQKAVSLSDGWYAAPADTLDEETAVKGFAEGEALTLSQACMENGGRRRLLLQQRLQVLAGRGQGGPGPAPPARYLRRRETVAQRPGADAGSRDRRHKADQKKREQYPCHALQRRTRFTGQQSDQWKCVPRSWWRAFPPASIWRAEKFPCMSASAIWGTPRLKKRYRSC